MPGTLSSRDSQRAGHFARRAPSSQRDRRNRFEVAPKPPGRVRLGRIRRPPDVEPLKVRPARILIAGSLNDGEAPLVEDALQPGQPRMQTERPTARVAADLEHLTGGHGDRRAGGCNRTDPDTARRYSAHRSRPRDTRRQGCETALPARGRCHSGTPAP